MLGRKLTDRLISIGSLRGERITAIDLVDVVAASPSRDGRSGAIEVESIVGDLTRPETADDLASRQPEVVFHLAGVVSGEAEANFAKGYAVNLDGARNLFDALAVAEAVPRVVFTSSIAVFGAPFPDVITDDFHLTPLTSYGTQKAIGEQLLADYSRRELIDGIGIRLPTITVRPGAPNAAASGFFSGIIREPLAGQAAYLPVPTTVRQPHASPRSAIGFLVHAAELDGDDVGHRRNMTMPSISATVQDQLDALAEVAGPNALSLIEDRADPAVATIVEGWPQRFATDRADDLGFGCEQNYVEIIQAYLEDDAPQPSTS